MGYWKVYGFLEVCVRRGSTVLSEVFKLLFVGSHQPSQFHVAFEISVSPERELEDGGWSEDLTSPTLFPFSPALVCRNWHNILACSPHYWGRLLFYVNEDPPALVGALSWSKDHYIVYSCHQPNF